MSALHALGEIGLAFVVVALLTVASRWAFGVSARSRATAAGDYGLLVAATTVAESTEAARLAAYLVSRGVRATVAPERSGGPAVLVSHDGRARRLPAPGSHVLVFPADLDRARSLLASCPDSGPVHP